MKNDGNDCRTLRTDGLNLKGIFVSHNNSARPQTPGELQPSNVENVERAIRNERNQ